LGVVEVVLHLFEGVEGLEGVLEDGLHIPDELPFALEVLQRLTFVVDAARGWGFKAQNQLGHSGLAAAAFPCQGENLRRLKLQFEGDPAHCFDLGFDKALSLSEYLGNVIQYKQLVVVHWPPSCRKHATLCRLPTSLRRGASLRQRSMAKGQRG